MHQCTQIKNTFHTIPSAHLEKEHFHNPSEVACMLSQRSSRGSKFYNFGTTSEKACPLTSCPQTSRCTAYTYNTQLLQKIQGDPPWTK